MGSDGRQLKTDSRKSSKTDKANREALRSIEALGALEPVWDELESAEQTRCTGEDGERQSMISRRYGVRSVRQRPCSDDARCESTR